MNLLNDWRMLRAQIRFFPEVAAQNNAALLRSLEAYRAELGQLSHKPIRLDQKVHNAFVEIQTAAQALSRLQAGRLLRSPSRLRVLHSAWIELINDQEELLELLQESIGAARFYDRMETAKREKRRLQANLK